MGLRRVRESESSLRFDSGASGFKPGYSGFEYSETFARDCHRLDALLDHPDTSSRQVSVCAKSESFRCLGSEEERKTLYCEPVFHMKIVSKCFCAKNQRFCVNNDTNWDTWKYTLYDGPNALIPNKLLKSFVRSVRRIIRIVPEIIGAGETREFIYSDQ